MAFRVMVKLPKEEQKQLECDLTGEMKVKDFKQLLKKEVTAGDFYAPTVTVALTGQPLTGPETTLADHNIGQDTLLIVRPHPEKPAEHKKRCAANRVKHLREKGKTANSREHPEVLQELMLARAGQSDAHTSLVARQTARTVNTHTTSELKPIKDALCLTDRSAKDLTEDEKSTERKKIALQKAALKIREKELTTAEPAAKRPRKTKDDEEKYREDYETYKSNKNNERMTFKQYVEEEKRKEKNYSEAWERYILRGGNPNAFTIWSGDELKDISTKPQKPKTAADVILDIADKEAVVLIHDEGKKIMNKIYPDSQFCYDFFSVIGVFPEINKESQAMMNDVENLGDQSKLPLLVVQGFERKDSNKWLHDSSVEILAPYTWFLPITLREIAPDVDGYGNYLPLLLDAHGLQGRVERLNGSQWVVDLKSKKDDDIGDCNYLSLMLANNLQGHVERLNGSQRVVDLKTKEVDE